MKTKRMEAIAIDPSNPSISITFSKNVTKLNILASNLSFNSGLMTYSVNVFKKPVMNLS